MYVPLTRHVTIVNKTIVYSDTVLNLKETGENLKVTTISGVDESSLENCLKTIFKANPGVTFNTVQYSKNKKTIYFYTDKEISTKEYEESKFYKFEPISTSADILEEIKSVFVGEKNKDINCVSLYDVARILKLNEDNYKKIISRYNIKIENALRAHNDKSNIIVYGFDFINDELRIGYGKNYEKICFSKKDGDLFVTKSEYYYANEVLAMAASELSELYDELIKFKNFNLQRKNDIKPVNSNFIVDINYYGVKVFVNNPDNSFLRTFELDSHSYTDEYRRKCNSSLVLDAIVGNETEFLKRIFVNIDNCPEWMRNVLREVRKEQLDEEQRILEENKMLEEKKQKRLEIKRKFFPWIKK